MGGIETIDWFVFVFSAWRDLRDDGDLNFWIDLFGI